MAEAKPLEAVEFRIGAKGRSVIPSQVREAAHVAPGDIVVAYAEAPGRIVLETREAIQERVWSFAPRGESTTDATVDTRAMRDEDNAIADANFERRAQEVTEEHAANAGRALLDALGL